MDEQSPWSAWSVELPPDFLEPVLVDLTTLAVEKQNLVTRSIQDGQFFRVEWHQIEHMRRWARISEATAQQLCEPVRKYRNLTHWLELFGEPPPKEEGSGQTKKHRATKEETLLKTYAAIAHKMARPAASEADCATEADIPRSTLAARPEWMEWSQMIERAAANGTLAKLKPAYDKRIDQIVATRE